MRIPIGRPEKKMAMSPRGENATSRHLSVYRAGVTRITRALLWVASSPRYMYYACFEADGWSRAQLRALLAAYPLLSLERLDPGPPPRPRGCAKNDACHTSLPVLALIQYPI